MGARTRVATAAAAVTLAAVAGASAAFPLDARAVVREFTPADLPGTFRSAFKNDEKCPNSVTFGDGSLNDKGVFEVPWQNIRENGSPCSGDGSMRFFTKAVALDPAALAEAGFPDLQKVINDSAPARTTLFNGLRTTDALIGWDGGVERTCGSTTYAADTFFFFVSERATLDITINTIKTTIAPSQQGMFIASNGPVLCVLTSPKVAPIPTQSPTPAPTPQPTPTPAVPTQEPTSQPVVTGPVVDPTEDTPTPSPEVLPSPEATPVVVDLSTPTPTPGNGGDDDDDTDTADGAASPSDDEDDSVCFPGDAEVLLSSGKTVTMADLQVGDAVLVSGGRFSPVYVFTHRTTTAARRYVRLTASSGAAVTVTASHYVHTPAGLVAAGAVAVGDDLVLADGSPSRVVAVDTVTSSGLYNPQTIAGDIVVGGLKVSTYTTAVDPTVASAALAPLRGLWASGLAMPQGLVSAVEGSARWVLTRMAPVLGGAASLEL